MPCILRHSISGHYLKRSFNVKLVGWLFGFNACQPLKGYLMVSSALFLQTVVLFKVAIHI